MEKLNECMERNTIITTDTIKTDMEASGEFAEEIALCLKKHFNNDFGTLGEMDIKMNLAALKSDLKNDRVLSRYETNYGNIYIISELYNTKELDIVTTVLYCDEY